MGIGLRVLEIVVKNVYDVDRGLRLATLAFVYWFGRAQLVS